jgi:hypothetical protein
MLVHARVGIAAYQRMYQPFFQDTNARLWTAQDPKLALSRCFSAVFGRIRTVLEGDLVPQKGTAKSFQILVSIEVKPI